MPYEPIRMPRQYWEKSGMGPTTMPTNSPAEMSNEELVQEYYRSRHRGESTYQGAKTELLRRLNRADGLEARVVEAMREVDIQYESIPTRKTDDGYTTMPAEMFNAVAATFAAIREEGVQGE